MTAAQSKTAVARIEIDLLSLGFAECLDAIADVLARKAATIRARQIGGESGDLTVLSPGAGADWLFRILPEKGAFAVGKFTLTPTGGWTEDGRPTFKCTSVKIDLTDRDA
jgi:hypothetical protein